MTTFFDDLKKRLEQIPGVTYLSAQWETTPTTGKDHVQGYIEFDKSVRRKSVKDALGDPAAHLQVRRGTRVQARDYSLKTEETLERYPKWRGHGVRKADTVPFEFGTWDERRRPGRRTDLDIVWNKIKAGAAEYDILEEFPALYMRNYRAIAKARQMYTTRHQVYHRDVDVRVYWGNEENKRNALLSDFEPFEIYEITDLENLWLDGYSGQRCVLIDNTAGMSPSYLSRLLKICSGYRARFNTKGGTVNNDWDTVVILSENHPRDWFTHTARSLQRKFARMLSSVQEIKNVDPMDLDEEDPWDNIDESVRTVNDDGHTVSVVPVGTGGFGLSPISITPPTSGQNTILPKRSSDDKLCLDRICPRHMVPLGGTYDANPRAGREYAQAEERAHVNHRVRRKKLIEDMKTEHAVRLHALDEELHAIRVLHFRLLHIPAELQDNEIGLETPRHCVFDQHTQRNAGPSET